MTLFIILMDEKTQGKLTWPNIPNSGQLSTVRPIPPCTGCTARSARPGAAVDLWVRVLGNAYAPSGMYMKLALRVERVHPGT